MKEICIQERRIIYLDMCQYLHDFCLKNNIRYSIAFGTLLGAVRHKGFIPWDDDFDIVMTVDEYLKFKKLWNNTGRYKIIDCHLENNYNRPFPRLYDSYTYKLDYNTPSYGVCIDIYMSYKTPDNTTEVLNIAKKVIRLRKFTLFLIRIKEKLERWHLWTFKLSHLINYLVRRFCHILSHTSQLEANSTMSIIYGSFSSVKKPFLSRFLNDHILLEFEDRIFFALKEYDELLTLYYGDYMQLPPENQRVPYHGGRYYWK